MIKLENITKKFGDKKIFDEFSLSIKEGEFVIISGKSGSGKTTLLNIIGGIEPVNSGSVVVNGIDLCKKKNLLTYYRNEVGFIFQNYALVDGMTVKQNLSLVKKTYRTDLDYEQALTMVGLDNVVNNYVYTLSGGEQQRVALARLLIKKCNLILADEPTGSVDKENTKLIMKILLQMNKSGKTIILVTHDESIKKYGTKIIEI